MMNLGTLGIDIPQGGTVILGNMSQRRVYKVLRTISQGGRITIIGGNDNTHSIFIQHERGSSMFVDVSSENPHPLIEIPSIKPTQDGIRKQVQTILNQQHRIPIRTYNNSRLLLRVIQYTDSYLLCSCNTQLYKLILPSQGGKLMINGDYELQSLADGTTLRGTITNL